MARSERHRSPSTRSVSRKDRPHSLVFSGGTHSPSSSDPNLSPSNGARVVLGICAMDTKTRSRPMREILTRINQRGRGLIEIRIFGDKVLFDEDVAKWPRCDVLIAFYSTDFPLKKAMDYVQLRKPICVNDVAMQELLFDRRIVGSLLDHLEVPTPRRLEASRDGGPKVAETLRQLVLEKQGLDINEARPMADVRVREDGDAIIVNGQVMEKPFVEKPVDGEDHNIWIYFKGGGGRKLFRKVGNKSSDLDPNLVEPRKEGSYIYEEFIGVDNWEDIKVYTIGPQYTHAETRKSPVVDGVVRRNNDGKEIRFITRLTEPERQWAAKIAEGFGQHVCGFDLLRSHNGATSVVIDVNGWSFVKGNDSYYDKAAEIIVGICSRTAPSVPEVRLGDESSSWALKASVAVFRHADRTPKQKLKISFPVDAAWAQPFIKILGNEKEEIILREKELGVIGEAIKEAQELGAGPEEIAKLTQLNKTLVSKIDLPGTKAQLKPNFTKKVAGNPRTLQKLQLVFKWGGEFTHAARYQSRDLGEVTKKDLLLMNKDALENVRIYTSSERRVTASADIFASTLLDVTPPIQTLSYNLAPSLPTSHSNTINSRSSDTSSIHSVRNAPSSVNNGELSASASFSLSNPHNIAKALATEVPPIIIRKDLLDDSNAAKDLMDDVKKRLKILLRPGESEKRPELGWPKSMNKEPAEVVAEVIQLMTEFRAVMEKNYKRMNVEKLQDRWCCGDEPWLFRERWEKLFEDFCDVKQEKFDPSRISELYDTIKYCALHHRTFLFSIFDEKGIISQLRHNPDRKLHELYGRAKVLFDLVAPQEYGIEAWEKEEIGILTSLPLLHQIVQDLETARKEGGSGLTLYFTKESHMYPLVNLVILSGLPIANPLIPELDYCSHITFELYERNGGRENSDVEYSIKLSLSTGAHSSNVLDSAVDARHSLNVRPRKKLTEHLPYSLVIEKLSKHFYRLPSREESDPESSPPIVPDIRPESPTPIAGPGEAIFGYAGARTSPSDSEA